MLDSIKTLLRGTPLYYGLRSLRSKLTAGSRIRSWEQVGRPAPPPHEIKEAAIREYGRRYRLNTLIETGTYLGDMVQMMKGSFDHIYTIELSPELCARARKRFASSPKVTVLEGSSDAVLGGLLAKLELPVLFWLDAHYSGGVTARGIEDTPVIKELDLIFRPGAPKHVVLIDDARCFGVDEGYPTLDEVTAYVTTRAPGYSVTVADDAIRIVPGAPA